MLCPLSLFKKIYFPLQAILDWQEHSPGPETSKYIELLEETIQKYLTWNFADQNTFKILKFLAAGILRVRFYLMSLL